MVELSTPDELPPEVLLLVWIPDPTGEGVPHQFNRSGIQTISVSTRISSQASASGTTREPTDTRDQADNIFHLACFPQQLLGVRGISDIESSFEIFPVSHMKTVTLTCISPCW